MVSLSTECISIPISTTWGEFNVKVKLCQLCRPTWLCCPKLGSLKVDPTKKPFGYSPLQRKQLQLEWAIVCIIRLCWLEAPTSVTDYHSSIILILGQDGPKSIKACVSFHNEWFTEVRETQNWGRRETFFQLMKGSPTICVPSIGKWQGGNWGRLHFDTLTPFPLCYEVGCNIGKSWDESSVVAGQAHEGSYFMLILGLIPLFNGAHLLWVSGYAFCWNNMAQKWDSTPKPVTL